MSLAPLSPVSTNHLQIPFFEHHRSTFPCNLATPSYVNYPFSWLLTKIPFLRRSHFTKIDNPASLNWKCCWPFPLLEFLDLNAGRLASCHFWLKSVPARPKFDAQILLFGMSPFEPNNYFEFPYCHYLFIFLEKKYLFILIFAYWHYHYHLLHLWLHWRLIASQPILKTFKQI